MKKIYKIAAILIALIGVLFLATNKKDPITPLNAKSNSQRERHPIEHTPPPSPTVDTLQLEQIRDEKVFQKYGAAVSKKAEAFLATHNRSADALSACYLLTGNAKYLNELAIKARSDPKAIKLLAATSLSTILNDSNDWLGTIQTMRNQDPKDSALAIMEAAILQRSSRQTEARELAKSLGKMAIADFNLKNSDRIMRELLVESGVPVKEAWKTSYYRNSTQESNLVPYMNATALALNVPPSERNPEAMTLFASEIVGFARTISGNVSAIDPSAHAVNAIESVVLSKLDPETEYGDDGTTVRQRLAQLEIGKNRSDYIQRNIIPFVENVNQATFDQFLEKIDLDGVDAAARWLESEAKLR